VQHRSVKPNAVYQNSSCSSLLHTATLPTSSCLLAIQGADTSGGCTCRPPLPKDDALDKLPAATTATTCAAMCDRSQSETNGEEACLCASWCLRTVGGHGLPFSGQQQQHASAAAMSSSNVRQERTAASASRAAIQAGVVILVWVLP
jgi:hypothetical protein